MYEDADIVIGDARRCPRHPGMKTSSDDGMFDGPCPACELAMYEDAYRWDCDPDNPKRRYCRAGAPDGTLIGIKLDTAWTCEGFPWF